MIKLITPPGMLLTVALLVICSVCAFLIGSIEKSWMLVAGGGISAIAGYGTAMLRPWSRYLVYLSTAGFALKLGGSVYQGVESGYFAFQFGSSREAVLSLAPSIGLLALLCVSCVLVYRHFNGKSPRPPAGPR